MSEHQKIKERFSELVYVGDLLFDRIKESVIVDDKLRGECISWFFSAMNLLEIATAADSRFQTDARRLLPAADATIYRHQLGGYPGDLEVCRRRVVTWTYEFIRVSL